MFIAAHAAAAFTHNVDALIDALSTPHTGRQLLPTGSQRSTQARTGPTVGDPIQPRCHDGSCVGRRLLSR